MTRRVLGQVMKDRIVGSADPAPEIRIRRAASSGVRELLRVPEETVGINHRLAVWDAQSP